MPRRINFEADAVPFRRGNTDYIETSVGRRAIRTFSGADGSWKLSNLGKRFFKSNALPEVVLRIPCVFLTTKKNGQELRHLGWFPYELLDEGLRARASLGSTCPAPTPRTEPGGSRRSRTRCCSTWTTAGTPRQAGLSYILKATN